jgi:transposase InsO family protein
MCQAAEVSRAGFYRHRNEPSCEDRDMDLRDVIQKIALEMPTYGRRRITAELKRRGWKVNGKRVRRTALRRALAERRPPPGLVHHSDRGVQYACVDYTALLKQHQWEVFIHRKHAA